MTTLTPSELLKPNALQQTIHAQGQYTAKVDNDVTLDRVLTPGFWAHHATTLKAGDKIEVMRLDFSLDVTLRVIRVLPGLVQVRELFPAYVDDADLAARQAASAEDATVKPEDVPEGYKLGHNPNGRTPGHFVQLNATGVQVAAGLKSRREALVAAQKHAAASATPAKTKAPA